MLSFGLAIANAGYSDVAQRRNNLWILSSSTPNAAEAETSVMVLVKVAWSCDYDSPTAVGIWSDCDGYYVEQARGTVSGDRDKNYQLQFFTPPINGVHKYQIRAEYMVNDEWLSVPEGVKDFEIEVTNGEPPNPLVSIKSQISIPGFPVEALYIGAGAVAAYLSRRK